jgi:hypothetical protein
MSINADTIVDLERRLKRCGVSVAHVCRAAGIDRVTWHRWKGGAPPRRETWGRVREVLVPLIGDVPTAKPAEAA